MRFTVKQIVWLKVLLHLAGFLPLVWLFWAGHQGYFSADPAKDIQHFTGRMALKFLLATLLVSPLARYAKQPLLIRVRRLLGLWCFAWATLHLTSYTLLELGINNLALLGSEIITRPYLTLGMISWAIRAALADMGEALATGADGSDADDRFHNAIAAATHNRQITRFVEFLGAQFSASRKATWDRTGYAVGITEVGHGDHAAILQAIESADAAQAKALAQAHVQRALDRVLVRLSGRAATTSQGA